jgi:uncharacterized membrane protein
MRINYLVVKNERRRVVWSALLAFVALCYAGAIALVEGLWYVWTGHTSESLVWIALLAASLYVVRALAQSLETPTNQLPMG